MPSTRAFESRQERRRWIMRQLQRGRTLVSVGNEIGLTRERIRQIAAHPVRRIGRPPARNGRRRKSIGALLGRRLRSKRESQGETLADVCRECGVSVGTLSCFERGIATMPVEAVGAAARHLGVEPRRLIPGRWTKARLRRLAAELRWPLEDAAAVFLE